MEWRPEQVIWALVLLATPLMVVLLVAVLRGYNMRVKVWRPPTAKKTWPWRRRNDGEEQR